MVRSKTIEIAVGLFILLGCLALIFLALRVSGLSVSTGQQSYTIYANFDDVSGLKTRAQVSIAGVTVGKVTAITLNPKTFQAKVSMAIDKDVKLTDDSSAAILTAGLLGEKYIGLSEGADEAYLKNGGTIYDTQSALVLEKLIGQFLFDKAKAG
jgi:phospholipid/cholesterol/gamma-HCH transport system substrate-binding protein